MDFITLATRLRQECGVSGTQTTVTGASGEWKRLCDWISQAWEDIQTGNPDWDWMKSSCTVNTVAGDNEYTAADFGITDFAAWRKDSFRIYLTSAGVGSQWLLPYREYNSFRDYYLLSSRQTTQARPVEMTISPSKSILLGPIPDDVYTVTGEYFKTATVLTADSDTPEMPARFHMAIVYRAMMSYGRYEAAGEVYQAGELEYNRMMRRIAYDQAPDVTLAGALV